MRRRRPLRTDRSALVAIYDALLFLMVVILISVGMFLYTASTAPTNGAFTDSTYQLLAENELTAVEGLFIEPPLLINRTTNVSKPLDELFPTANPTVRWLLGSGCVLSTSADDYGVEYDRNAFQQPTREVFMSVRLQGTHFAWALICMNETIMFGSDNITSLEDLPQDRWVVTRDYSDAFPPSAYDFRAGGSRPPKAELRFFFWLA